VRRQVKLEDMTPKTKRDWVGVVGAVAMLIAFGFVAWSLGYLARWYSR
jgi:hypothetical protein